MMGVVAADNAAGDAGGSAAAASPTPPAPTDAAALETSKAPAAADRTEALALGPYAWPSNEKADADREDVVLPPHLETDERYRLDRYAHRGRAGFLV